MTLVSTNINWLHARSLISVISYYRFSLLTLLIGWKLLVDFSNGIWVDDFWHHSAVVHALMKNLWQPEHPFFNNSISHAFYSPYSILVAVVGRLLSIDAITSLSLFGIVNFFFLCFSLKQFMKIVSNEVEFSPFYCLLFILFLWGSNPWGFSGFFQFDNIAYVLPYPSTFTFSLSLLVLSLLWRLSLASMPISHIIIGILSGSIIFLSHPITFTFYLVGLGSALSLAFVERKFRIVINYLFIIIGSIILALVWPYYSLKTLLITGNNVYDTSNEIMYLMPFSRLWPLIICAPCILIFKIKESINKLLIMLVVLALTYAIGYISEKYILGRVISFVAFLLQGCTAIAVAQAEQSLRSKYLKYWSWLVGVLFISLGLIAGVSWLPSTGSRTLTVLNSAVHGRPLSNQITYKDLTFLPRYVGPNDLVLADANTSWYVPSFSGKVLAALLPQAFVSDQAQRQEDLALFFDPVFDYAQQDRVLRRYHPKFLLIDKLKIENWTELADRYTQLHTGESVFENVHYKLIRLLND